MDSPGFNPLQAICCNVLQLVSRSGQRKIRRCTRFSKRTMTPLQCLVLLWKLSWVCLVTLAPVTFNQVATPALKFWRMYLTNGFWTAVALLTLKMKDLSSCIRPTPASHKQPSLITVTCLLSLWMTTMLVLCRDWHGYEWLVKSWKGWELTVKPIRRCYREKVGNSAMVIQVIFRCTKGEGCE